jgi:type I restriction enzyme R subunit
LALVKAFALAGATDAAGRVKAEVAFFQTVKAALAKRSVRGGGQAPSEMDHAIRQLIDQAITPGGVVDIFSAAGLAKPDISILSEGFLDDVRRMPQKNLAVELLRKLLNDEIATRGRGNLVEQRLFSERLKQALNRYQNRSIETAQVIEELLQLAREMRESQNRGEQLGLTADELAFYDALGGADMAAVMGDRQLLTVAREVARTVRDNATIDWTVRESVRANMRRMVKRTLNRLGYPPDKRDGAVETVVRQAELFTAGLVG